ncbi:glycosyltransferase [Williamsia sp. MIQD14]|uniref:glycosyltransferase n=1 Tax=Williamsia sp. MIQD14 TaxID=3425703 RepID=UPI003DA073AA
MRRRTVRRRRRPSAVVDAFALALAGSGLGMAVVNARHVHPLRAPTHPVTGPVVVLVPARDEAEVIADVVADLRAQRGVADLRVLIYDDESGDGTAEVARRAIDGDDRVVVIDGALTPKSPGWTGKAWGLHRLTAELSDDAPDTRVCLVDADVRLAPDAIAAAVAVFDSLTDAPGPPPGLLSVWPAQIVGSTLERMVQPLLFWSWFSMLPQAITEQQLRTSTAVANGQFLTTRLGVYRDVGGHRSVAAEPADDIALARVFRRAGMRTVNRSGGHLVRCRMYRSGADLRGGYRRWTATEFGGARGSWAVVAALLVGHVGPVARTVLGPRRTPATLALTMGAVGRIIARRVETDSLAPSDVIDAMAHPVSMAAAAALIADSAVHTRAGRLEWKGRSIS